jgi:integrase
LSSRSKTPATANRYGEFISLAYREGIRNGKIEVNPARLVQLRKERNGRFEFVSREEFNNLQAVIEHHLSEHLAEFIVSVHTGMRLTEQYSCKWSQVDLVSRTVELKMTKNGSARTIHLNADAMSAIPSKKRPGQSPPEAVFPREVTKGRFDARSLFTSCLKEAKITGYVWHGNRQTFCSWLAMAGASIKGIQEAAGHKTITTSARYIHLSPQYSQSVVERIVGSAQPRTSTE